MPKKHYVNTHREKRKFGGKWFALTGTAYNKVDAEFMAESARRNKYKARIIKRTGKGFGYGRTPRYAIYTRMS